VFGFGGEAVAESKEAKPWDAVFGRINYHRYPAWVAIPPATDDVLDRIEVQLGSRLPWSYRAFMKRFGSGDLGGILRLGPLESLVEMTTSQREFYAAEKQTNTDWLGRVVYFANTSGGDYYVWDPQDLAASGSGECPVYWLGRHEEEYPERVADSFYELISDRLARLQQLLRDEPEEGVENEFVPDYLRLKELPPSDDLVKWLAFNNNTARNLALAIRDRGQTDAFPILADALQEAGCTNADLLDSCRTGDPDIDGRWALQVLLGNA
jgi:hypothetical protein